MKFCRECGKEVHENAVTCPHCGFNIKDKPSKLIALLLWFFLGAFGAHRLYVNDTYGAIIYILSFTIGCLLILPPFVAAIFLIIDLINIIKGELHNVKLEG